MDPLPPLPLNLRIDVPAEQLEGLLREEIRKALEERVNWFTLQEAAEYVKMTFRTFQRKRKKIRLPVSEMDGVKRICRSDLDAMMFASVVVPEGKAIIKFPSIDQRKAALEHIGSAPSIRPISAA